MIKFIAIKLIAALVLVGLFISQNLVLLSTLSSFVTQLPPNAYICQSYVQDLDLKFSNAIEVSAVLGLISLFIALVLLYHLNLGKDSENT
jgi:di/tricarboxylate transporter